MTSPLEAARAVLPPNISSSMPDDVLRKVVEAVQGHQNAAIVDVLCGQALADDLGDVRDQEKTLWRLIGIEPHWEDSDSSEAWGITQDRLTKHGVPIPEYLRD